LSRVCLPGEVRLASPWGRPQTRISMDDLLDKVFQIAYGVWRRRWIALAVAWPLAIVGGVVTMVVPERFEASAQVYVNTQTMLQPLLKDITSQPDIDQQVAMLAKTLISRPNVEQLFSEPAIGFQQPPPRQFDAAVDRLSRAIRVTPMGKNLYAISYRDVDAQR